MAKKLKEKGRALIQKRDGIHGPDFNVLDYKISMIKNLNFYATDVDDKKKQGFAIELFKSMGLPVVGFSALPPASFATVGAVAHMKLFRELPIEDSEVKRIALDRHAYFTRLVSERAESAAKAEAAKVAKPVKVEVDQTPEIIGEIEGMLDEIVQGHLGKGNSSPNVLAFLKMSNVKAPVMAKVAQHFKKKVSELEEAYQFNEKQLMEGYGFLGKRGIKKILDFIETVQSATVQASAVAKVVRKPRAKKVVPPAKIVARLEYLKEHTELKLKSISPTKIVGATELYAYNVKMRRLIKLTALEGHQLTVTGTTVKNIDPATSVSKIVRKPEDVMKNFENMGKRAFAQLLKSLRGTEGKATGRMNGDVVLLGAF